MALARVKTWISGEVLTASDLNSEFNNILNNASSLISPLGGNLLFSPDATYDVGASGATRARDLFISRNFVAGGTINGNTLTTGTGTLTLGTGKTTTFDHTSTFTTTDGQTYTFPTTSATIARTDATNTFTGAQVFSSTITPQGLVDVSGASAGQIKYPATQNASSDANTLDDYEEGTFTPSIGGSATYTTQEGRYVKVGQLVHCSGCVVINSIGTGSSSAISGLPFTAQTTTSGNPEAAMKSGFSSSLAINTVSLGGYIASNTSIITLVGKTAAASGETNAIAVLQNSARVDFSISYRASA